MIVAAVGASRWRDGCCLCLRAPGAGETSGMAAIQALMRPVFEAILESEADKAQHAAAQTALEAFNAVGVKTED